MAEDISPNKDRGVLKKILKEGAGDETPGVGSFVEVKYTDFPVNTVCHSNTNTEHTVEFDLLWGQTFKALEICVATMKQGEVAVLTCAPEYAYGASGSLPQIPPNSTLKFLVELLGWKGIDVTHDRDGLVVKHFICAGEGTLTPTDGALVEVHVKGMYKGQDFDDRHVKFPLGEGEADGIPEGVEVALENFKKGEKSKVKLKSKYAFKNVGKPEYNIPANADLEYVVELINFEQGPQPWSLDVQQRFIKALNYKMKGISLLKESKFRFAVRKFLKVIEYLSENFETEDEELKKNKNDTLLQTHLNIAIMYITLKDQVLAIDHCNEAISLNNCSKQAFLTRGRALNDNGQYIKAVADFKSVLKLDPTDKDASLQLCKIMEKIRVDITESNDGGVYKKIRRKGIGNEYPGIGSIVRINFTGKLTNGETFYENNRDEPLSLQLLENQVIKGIIIGLLSMKKKEFSVFLCAPEYAYGEAGHEELNVPSQAMISCEVELIDWSGVDVSPEQDRRIIKIVTLPGTSSEKACVGSTVTINYAMRFLDGQAFDSPQEETLQFQLGRGQGRIKEWDIGIATMTKGEVAIFTHSSKYAYKDIGFTLSFPPNKTVQFKISLMDWHGDDLSPEHDRSIERFILAIGKEQSTPTHGSIITIYLEGKFNDIVFVKNEIKFQMGEGDADGIPEGVEIALRQFKKGEVSKVKVKSKYAFKNVGKPEYNIPPNADLDYVVQLKNISKITPISMLSDEGLQRKITLYTKKANRCWVNFSDMQCALKMYDRALDYTEYVKDDNLKLKYFTNITLDKSRCFIGLTKLQDAIVCCDNVIAINPNSGKAFFQKGEIYSKLGQLMEAYLHYEQAYKLNPSSAAFREKFLLFQAKVDIA